MRSLRSVPVIIWTSWTGGLESGHLAQAAKRELESLKDMEFVPEPDIQVAVLVPCRNEAASIEKVVRDFRAEQPTP